MNPPTAPSVSRSLAVRFVIFLGVVSLFADMTYEGARSVYGPFLGKLGAGAFLISIIAGAGELLGYALRLLSGRITDKTGRYWPVAIAGYLINLLSVPALALTGSWPPAAALVITERAGRAVRNPPRDAMLSHASFQIGRGWGFGLHEAMDQTGALIGPLLVALVLAKTGGDFHRGFAVLLVPAALSLSVLMLARRQFPHPQHLEIEVAAPAAAGTVTRPFWVYAAGAGLIAAGFADFPLIAYHFAQHSTFSSAAIPITYSLGMGAAAVGALLFGKLFDRLGLVSTVVGVVVAAAFAPLVFFGKAPLALGGIGLWGLGLGIQESAMRARIAMLVPGERRASAYGLFDFVFGICWFLGSAVMGLLYTRSLTALVTFSVAAQVLSVPLLLWKGKTGTRPAGG
jgi:predicted MFS family arabinose efflux permease